jgi:predicted GIY-YIG superfamily endonuclease/REP element-mobilizing transposase RayT
MPTLASELRSKLEHVVIEARDAAEAGARAALESLAVHEAKYYPHMSKRQQELRNHLRARARQLGDRQDASGRIAIDHLAGECAYEHWHRMLFARFLAENGLLIEPQEKIAISLAEAEELAKEGGADVWDFASRCAQSMLPQIFRPDLPAPRPKSGEFCVYVLKCCDSSFYIGQTDDFHRRLSEHERGEVGWTAARLPIEPIHWETFATREEAVRREKELKTGFGRQWLKREYPKGALAAAARQAGDPLLQVSFATEHRIKVEKLLASLPQAVFTASDALGWVYQFWQSKKKDEVNRSEVKIGADEISAVTQLFTEPYMVLFLLHNTLGAWWAGKVAAASSRWSSCASEADCRRLCALPGVNWEYLRFVKVEAASSRLDQDTRQDAASTIGFYRKDEPVANLSGNLPHWRQGAVTYFVTFRTADSLPQEKLKLWQSEREQWLAQHPEPHDEDAKREYYERFPERLEHWLDQGYGACRLKEPALRKLVQDALRHFDGERYNLDEFVVSANHVHALVTPRHGRELTDILHSWKSFTANQINRQTAQSGAFWQKESFDHIVRSPAQLERIREYIRDHKDKDASSAESVGEFRFG